jgi:hypothetical protein
MMKTLRSFLTLALIIFAFTSFVADGQDAPSAVWQVTQFDINANVSPIERTLTSHAVLTIRNVGRGNGSSLSVRLSPQVEMKSVSVNNANATFRASPEERFKLQRIAVTLPAPVVPNATVSVAFDYVMRVAENNGLAAITPNGSQFLPLSAWYPAINTQFAIRGADTAPVRLQVNGENVVAPGVITQKDGGAIAEQSLNAQPFFVTGKWDAIEGAGEARGISALAPTGAGAEERKQAEALIAFASAARSYYVGILGAAPSSPIRLVAVSRGAGTNNGGVLLLEAAAFRRSKLDSATALLIAETVARLWAGGAAPVRGEGAGVLREGLPRYLATLFLEKQFGREVADAERMRERIAYATISKRDPPLARTTPLDDTYFNSSGNKGAMLWRLVERALGRDAFLNLLRTSLSTNAGREASGLTLEALRAALVERGGASLKTLLDQELDQPTDMDLLVGVPQQRGGQWVAALRNVGSLAATVSVVATLQNGQRVSVETNVPARSFGEAIFKTTVPVVRAEVDPDKLYPQLDYTNDIAPRSRLSADSLVEATGLLARQDYAGVETLTREMLAVAPHQQEARILLGRALLAQNKNAEAEKEFRNALDEPLPTPATLGWSNLGLGETALRQNRATEAARFFNEAVRADAEYASSLAARVSRLKAEAAANSPSAIDATARTFVAQLDAAIKSGRKADLDALIVSGQLAAFSKGIVGTQPEQWTTQVLRTETLDANHLAADVQVTARTLGRDAGGTAVFVLTRVGGSWKLEDILFSELR